MILNYLFLKIFKIKFRMGLDGFFKFGCVKEKFTPETLIKDFGLNPQKPICDGYGHSETCTWFVQECKSDAKVTKAITQLKSTIEQLESKGKNIEKAFIIGKRICKSEQRIYGVDNDKLFFKANNGDREPVLINSAIEVFFVRSCDLNEVRVRWHLS